MTAASAPGNAAGDAVGGRRGATFVSFVRGHGIAQAAIDQYTSAALAVGATRLLPDSASLDRLASVGGMG